MLSHYDAIKQVRTNLDEKIEAIVLRIGDAPTKFMRDSLYDDLEQMQGEYVILTDYMALIAQCERDYQKRAR